MRRLPVISLITAALTLQSVASLAQQTLSFEPGGREACAKAIQQPLPGPNDNPRSFGYACAEHDLQIEKTQFDALSKTLDSRSAEERVAFNVLMVSFVAFRDASLKTPPCGTGAGCGLFDEDAKARSNYDFLQLASQRVKLPDGGDFSLADADLNASYDKAFASLPSTCDKPGSVSSSPCVSQSQFRDEQRAWIRYRDAWLTFVKVRWPNDVPDAWLTYLTHQRTQQIKAAFPS
jgi:uncharacterized protein YecT (DUF1311 family)